MPVKDPRLDVIGPFRDVPNKHVDLYNCNFNHYTWFIRDASSIVAVSLANPFGCVCVK